MQAQALRPLKNKEVDVYSQPACGEPPRWLETGYLKGITGDALQLTTGPKGAVHAVIELSTIGMVCRKQRLQVHQGGKVLKMAEAAAPGEEQR